VERSGVDLHLDRSLASKVFLVVLYKRKA
jgi:hypothetical protein